MQSVSLLRRIALASVLAVAILPAHAVGLFRAYLASDGLDSNPCTVNAPCRLLPAALTAVTDGGEIWMLDSANYNTATVLVTKSVTVLAVPGAVGSVVATGGPAIQSSTPGIRIALRNLVIVPLPGTGGNNAVVAFDVASLALEDCVVTGHLGHGLYVNGTVALRVTRGIFRDNVNSGIFMTGGTVAAISGVQVLNNGASGIVVYANSATPTTASISDAVISGNGSSGVEIQMFNSGNKGRAFITRSTISDHATGAGVAASALPSGTAVLTVGYSMIAGNSIAFSQNGLAVVESLGNNVVRQNATFSAGTLTTVPTL
jgi:hypothetical protein